MAACRTSVDDEGLHRIMLVIDGAKWPWYEVPCSKQWCDIQDRTLACSRDLVRRIQTEKKENRSQLADRY